MLIIEYVCMYIITLTLIYVITGREFMRPLGNKVKNKRNREIKSEE